MRRFLKKRWYVVLILILIVGVVIYRRQQAQVQSAKERSYTVKRGTVKDTISLSGTLDAHEKITLQFQSSGMLSWVGVKVGDYVQKGQAVAALDQRDVQMRMQKYLNSYVSERLDFDQNRDDSRDVKTGTLTPDQKKSVERAAQKAQNDLNNAVLDVELQSLAKQYANLSSPIEGKVVEVDSPYAGVNITPSQARFVIINPNTVYFSALADQTEVVKLQPGMKAEIVFDSYPDKKTNAFIDSISYTPKDGESGTVYEVKYSLDDLAGDDSYRMGMTGDVDMVLQERNNVVVVPVDYIKSLDDKPYVYRMVGGKKQKVTIRTGLVTDTDAEVLSGLQEGDVIYD